MYNISTLITQTYMIALTCYLKAPFKSFEYCSKNKLYLKCMYAFLWDKMVLKTLLDETITVNDGLIISLLAKISQINSQVH